MIRKTSLVITLFIFITNCSENSSDYYPLNEGIKWDYNLVLSSSSGSVTIKVVVENMGKRELNKQTVVPQKATFDHTANYTFVKESENGIQVVGEQGVNNIDPIIFDSPRYVIKNPIKNGNSWQTKRKLMFASTKDEYVMTEKIESINEIVTTQSGTYKNCLKIRGYGELFVKDPWFGWMKSSSKVRIRIEMTDYYAPNVGFIKGYYREKSNYLHVSGGEMMNELLSIEK